MDVEKDFILTKKFTTNGRDVWELVSCFLEPSCELKNTKTGESVEFAVTSLVAETFKERR